PDALPQGIYYLRTTNGQFLVNGLYADFRCLNCVLVTGTPVSVQDSTVTGINFALAPAGRFAGRVSDATTAAGIRGATVHVYDPTGVEAGWSATDVGGTFLSAPVPAGSYFTQVTNNAGYINQLYQGVVCILCTVTNGTMVPIAAGAITPGVNFELGAGGR